MIGVLREMKAARQDVVGMNMLGVGALVHRMETAIRHAVQLDAAGAKRGQPRRHTPQRSAPSRVNGAWPRPIAAYE